MWSQSRGEDAIAIDDVLAEMPGMGRGKAHPADSWNLSDGVQQFRKSHLP